jgi:hypothetical protein
MLSTFPCTFVCLNSCVDLALWHYFFPPQLPSQVFENREDRTRAGGVCSSQFSRCMPRPYAHRSCVFIGAVAGATKQLGRSAELSKIQPLQIDAGLQKKLEDLKLKRRAKAAKAQAKAKKRGKVRSGCIARFPPLFFSHPHCGAPPHPLLSLLYFDCGFGYRLRLTRTRTCRKSH